MVEGVQIAESCSVHGRIVARGRAPDGVAPDLYLVQRLSPTEPAPTHRNLPAVSGVVEVDGQEFWLVLPPHGLVLGDLVQGKQIPSAVALERTHHLGQAMETLSTYHLLPGDFFQQVVWVGDRLVLDYPAALLGAGRPSFPALAERSVEQGAAITLLAVLHATMTGKAATEPPYLFRAPSHFGIECPVGVTSLLAEGLAGAIGLPEAVRRVRELDAEQRLVRLFPPPVTPDASERTDSHDRRSQTRIAWVADWLVWLVCMVGGIVVLVRWG